MTWMNSCPACGAEESLDALIMRIIDDQETRTLIADLMCMSLPLGGKVVHYLRLFKPPQQRLRLLKAGRILAELVPDMRRCAIDRKGREWKADWQLWSEALDAVGKAAREGTLKTPLDNNAYLYEVVMRMVDKLEGDAERATQNNLRHRAVSATGPDLQSVAEALAPKPLPILPRENLGPSRHALQVQAQMKAHMDRRNPTTTTDPQPTEGEPNGHNVEN
jgi:hypothetical protein